MLLLGAAGLWLVGSGCAEDGGPGAPAEPGAILLTVTTAGTMIDPDGYELYVDDEKLRDVGLDETVAIEGIAPGSRTIELRDVQANCRDESLSVRRTIRSGRTEGVRFDVTCELAHLDRIAFTSDRAGTAHIYSVQVDGKDLRQHTFGSQFDTAAAYSPDGTRIAFHRDNDDVYVMNVDGSGLVNLSDDPEATDVFPSWSADGTQIAFGSNRDGAPEIYVVDADGASPAQRLTFGTIGPTGADWSPDGTRFVYALFTANPSEEIYVYDRDDEVAVPLTDTAFGRHELPRWSPDGSRIAYYFWNLGNEGIYVMNADGTGAARVAGTTILDEHPSWSPDGTQLAFTSERDEVRSVWVMGVDGSNPVAITDGAGSDFLPSWSPAGP